CLVHAADMKPIARVIAVTDVETDDPSGYVTWIAQYNSVAKAKLGIDNYIRVYETIADGRKTSQVRAVVAAKSFAELTKWTMTLESDPAIQQILDHMRRIRQLGARTLSQAIRFEGTYDHNSNYTTLAVLSDEAAYLKAL